MKTMVKFFTELSVEELWQIYEIRSRVFVVEQNCIYQDVDSFDKVSYHIMIFDEKELIGYARVLPKQTAFAEVSIGRVISTKRRMGVGTKVVRYAVSTAREKFLADKIVIAAQVYAANLYEKLGFQRFGNEFVDDGILHVKMYLE